MPTPAPAEDAKTPAATPPAETKAETSPPQEAKPAETKAEAKPETKKAPAARGLSGAFEEKSEEKAPAEGEKPKLELKFPDGTDDGFKAEATALAEKMGVDSEAAQRLVDALAEKQAEAEAKWGEQLDTWRKSLDTDAEVKKSGGVQRAMAQATLAMRKVGTPELAKVLADTGFEHHPEVVRAFIRIGRLLGEDSVRGTLSNGGATPKPQSLGELLYGKS
jgi:hypothetical protein